MILSEAERRLLSALAGMCDQYLLQGGCLDHLCMRAGEDAVALLAEYGMVDIAGRGATWTAAGQALLEER